MSRKSVTGMRLPQALEEIANLRSLFPDRTPNYPSHLGHYAAAALVLADALEEERERTQANKASRKRPLLVATGGRPR